MCGASLSRLRPRTLPSQDHHYWMISSPSNYVSPASTKGPSLYVRIFLQVFLAALQPLKILTSSTKHHIITPQLIWLCIFCMCLSLGILVIAITVAGCNGTVRSSLTGVKLQGLARDSQESTAPVGSQSYNRNSKGKDGQRWARFNLDCETRWNYVKLYETQKISSVTSKHRLGSFRYGWDFTDAKSLSIGLRPNDLVAIAFRYPMIEPVAIPSHVTHNLPLEIHKIHSLRMVTSAYFT